MHLNREYGRLDEEGAIEYAPKSVKLGGVINLHPTATDRIKARMDGEG